ncbi:MAG TPA: energy transducer TonB [Candidatus Aquilonibacter sp.]|nr:energy transducer TonB [Candidatus Aquilonibacter sp.]
MFEDSLVESAALLRTHNRWPAIISIASQCAIAVAIVSLPVLHPELLPMPHILPATLAPPRAPAPPPAHLTTRSSAASTSPAAPTTAVRSAPLAPTLIHLTGPAIDAPSLPAINLGDPHSSLPPGINTAAPAGPHVSIAPSVARSAPARISSGVSAGNLLAPIRPAYPEIARITHTEGTVVIDAIISRKGSIESARVLSGPPMLQAAALEAVRQARYRPFLLNDQPTEVQTTVTIVFRIGG